MNTPPWIVPYMEKPEKWPKPRVWQRVAVCKACDHVQRPAPTCAVGHDIAEDLTCRRCGHTSGNYKTEVVEGPFGTLGSWKTKIPTTFSMRCEIRRPVFRRRWWWPFTRKLVGWEKPATDVGAASTGGLHDLIREVEKGGPGDVPPGQ
jgi:hypothetical protein